ncbi:MAG TPA: LuxR C-terminal-related transcriptional regulator [Alphaproteobacteria bacterium]|nr:LuxR C-terminal-related transcriptional regulator [Alphaproteobacteria bacterium]
MAINVYAMDAPGVEVEKFPAPRLLPPREREILDGRRRDGRATGRLLAPREREVLDLLSKGRAYKQIAAEMELSMGTVRTYIRRLYGKLNVNCRTQAVVLYLTQPING